MAELGGAIDRPCGLGYAGGNARAVFRIRLMSEMTGFTSERIVRGGALLRLRSPDGALPGNSTPEAPRLRRRTRDMTPSRHSQIRGIQKKRYNKEILKPVAGSVWFFHVGDQNPG